jgi:hypothetical protein
MDDKTTYDDPRDLAAVLAYIFLVIDLDGLDPIDATDEALADKAIADRGWGAPSWSRLGETWMSERGLTRQLLIDAFAQERPKVRARRPRIKNGIQLAIN